MPTVDANVWVAGIDVADPHHETSLRFLGSVQSSARPLLGPSLLIVEVACAIARRIGDLELALAAAKTLHGLSTVRLFVHDEASEPAALAVGVRQRLGGAEAFYAAVAAETP